MKSNRKTITIEVTNSELDALEDVILVDYEETRKMFGKGNDDREECRDRRKALRLLIKLVKAFDKE